MTGYAGLGQGMAICKSDTAAQTGLRPACSRIKDNTASCLEAAQKHMLIEYFLQILDQHEDEEYLRE